MGTVANLAVRVSVNAQDVQKGLAGVEGAVTGVGGRLRNVGTAVAAAFSVHAITSAAEHAIEASSRIADMAERVGISAEAVQKLEFAASQSGSSFDAVATSIRVMADRLNDGKLPKALEDMGLSVQQLQAMTPDQAFITIADAIRAIPDPLLQSATAVDIFGRGAQQMLPAIKAGILDIASAAPIMSNAMIASADATGDKWHEMQLRISNLQAEALLPLLNAFTLLPQGVQVATAGLLAFMPSLSSIGIAILAAGGPTAALGSLMAAGTALGGFFTATLPALFAGGIAFFTTTLPAVFGTVLAFLGPQGLIALAVIAVGLVWYKWGDQITAIVAATYAAIKTWLYDKFAAVVTAIKAKIDAVTGYFKGMYDAVVGGSYVPDMVRGIDEHFAQLDGVMVAPTISATGFVASAFSNMAASVQNSIRSMLSELESTLTGWLDGFMPSWAAKLLGGLGGAVMNAGASSLMGMIGLGGGGGGMLGGGSGVLMSSLGGGGAGLLGGLFAGGTGAAGGVAGVEASILGGGAAAGGGLGATLGALATNPWTIGIAGAIGGGLLLKKLYGGGEEALKVNPARDQKYGGSHLAGTTAALEAAGYGGERAAALMSALNSADTMKELNAATAGIDAALAHPAGAGAVPADAMRRGGGSSSVSVHNHISTIDWQGVRDFVESPHFTNAVSGALRSNKGFLASNIKRVAAET